MNLTIELSEDNAAALASQARAAKMPTERFLAHIVEGALQRRHRQAVDRLKRHLDDMASQTSSEAISGIWERLPTRPLLMSVPAGFGVREGCSRYQHARPREPKNFASGTGALLPASA